MTNEDSREHLLSWLSPAMGINGSGARMVQKPKRKKSLTFLQLDIVEYYPSITESILDEALKFASKTLHRKIEKQQIEIIKHARNSYLFTNHTKGTEQKIPWCKKKGCFDVTMGSPDGAEICELVGLMLLDEIESKFPELNFGLYRDDGLAVHAYIPGPKLDRMRKELHKLFNKHGLKITVETKLQCVNFLDITLDLQKESYRPYKKPNNTTLYIHKDSNHPPSIIKEVPRIINNRLNHISSSEDNFKRASKDYQRALDESGYKHKLKYERKEEDGNTTTRKQVKKKREIVWFNPPFNRDVKTNVGKRFLRLIDKHFPEGHKLKKAINRNSVKISYSCTPNIRTIIQTHNAKILQNINQETTGKNANTKCNCRIKENCPLSNQCKAGPVVYMAKIKNNNTEKIYIGSTQDFKERLGNHKASFKNEKLKNATVLSRYVWDNNLGTNPEISWEILKMCTTYKKGSRYCDLCLSEKLFISKNLREERCLNRRNEMTSKCAHKEKFKLSRIKPTRHFDYSS